MYTVPVPINPALLTQLKSWSCLWHFPEVQTLCRTSGATGPNKVGWRSSKAGLSWETSSASWFQLSWQGTNQLFHSISFSFWCWLHPKRQRQWKGKEKGISCTFSVLTKGSVGPQVGIQHGDGGRGCCLHTSVSCGNWGESYLKPVRKTHCFPIFHGKPT